MVSRFLGINQYYLNSVYKVIRQVYKTKRWYVKKSKNESFQKNTLSIKKKFKRKIQEFVTIENT